MAGACVVEVVRGGFVDCLHRVAVCVTAADGTVSAATRGAADLPVFLRSAAKPFQAVPAVEAGVLERFGLDDRHLAVACASHAGTDEHAALVREILGAAGLDVAALALGDDGRHDRLRHNCSGNHALGLAHCVQAGWPVERYLEPGHPLQVAMRGAVAASAGSPADEAVDGCGMRAYRLPLGRFAAMFGVLAAATGALGRCADAMRAHPWLVNADGAIDTELMRGEPGLVAKLGAEAVIGVGLADGRGLALKVLDGAWRAHDPAALHACREGLGITLATPGLVPFGVPAVVNARGEVVGEILTRIRLESAKSA
jgi:L-asparaginase II